MAKKRRTRYVDGVPVDAALASEFCKNEGVRNQRKKMTIMKWRK